MSFSDFRPGLWDGRRAGVRRRRGSKQSRRCVFGLEMLENRLVLAASTWSGAVSNLWSVAGNWDTLPTAGSNLIFPSGAAHLSNTDDLTAVTSYGSLTLSGGGYTIGGTTGVTFTSIDSSQTASSSLNTLSLPITLSGPSTVTVDTAGESLVLGGVVSGSAGLTKAGSGTLHLTQTNTYTGTTAVQAGTLLVDGAQGGSTVTIVTGSTLGGIGTVGGITAAGGTLSPGDSGSGVLVDTGSLTLGADAGSHNSVFTVQLNAGSSPGTDYTQLQAAGPINLNGVQLNLTLGAGFVPMAGQAYMILDNTDSSAITGTFAGQAEGSTVAASGTSFLVSYIGGAGHSVVLTELAASTTSVTATPTAAVFGQSVSLKAAVAAASGGTIPTGTVEFFSGTTSLGTVTLSSGVGTLPVTSLPVATNSITAVYHGDTTFGASTSTAFSVTVAKAATTASVASTPASPVAGESVTLKAAVAPASPGAGTPTGTVTFFNGSTSLGTGTLNSGIATLATTALPAGTNSITAQYQGDANFSGITSPAVNVVIGQASTTTTVTFFPLVPFAGQNVTLTATIAAVSPGAGTPTGTVEFFNGATSLGSGAVNSSGIATFATTTLPAGTNSITANYKGDTSYTASTSPAVTVTVAPAATTTTTVTFSPSAPVFGQSVTLTATVASIASGAGAPTGTVQFFNGTTSLGTGTLNGSGVATLAVTSLPVAANSITGAYSGDATFTSSLSTAVTVTVAKASTTTTVTFSPAAPAFGQSVTLTATIASPGAGTPTGTVTFFNGTTSLGTGTLNSSGVATLAVTSLPVAANSITATYGGDTDFATSTSTAVTVTVAKASTTTTVTFSPAAPAFGQSVTLTATIAAASPGAGTPTGTVTFFNGTTSLGTGTLNSSGVATLALTSLPEAANSIVATYGGDTDFTTSTSSAVTVTVGQPATTTTLTVSVPSPTPFEAVTLTATVASVISGAGTPTGTVTFLDGTNSLGTATLNSSGVATLAVSSLAIGSNSITAAYSGDTNFAGSTSPAKVVVVGTANEQWLAAVYQLDLNREISQSDLQGWDQQFADGRSRKSIALAIGNSPEGKQTIVQNAFQQYLGRSASSTEVTKVMLAASSTGTSARAIILGSREFFDLSGGNLKSYAAALETAVLGTTFNPGFVASQLAKGVLPATVAEEILLSARGKSALLASTYELVLSRAPSAQENVSGVELLDQSIYLRDIQAALIASAEFYDAVVVSLATSS